MSSKSEILKAVRQHLVEAVELPSLDQSWIEYPDAIAQFSAVLSGVGGRCVLADNIESAVKELNQIPEYAQARKTVSLVEGIGNSTFDFEAVDDPHDLEDVDFAVLPGHFAVAENAAVWVTDQGVKHRVIYFLPQHLALVVSADQVLHNMHQAYDRLNTAPDAAPPFEQAGFGTFISGPSKTADIEQSLVIGAHGARSLTVILLQNIL